MKTDKEPLSVPHECSFEVKGIMRDGSVIEYCPKCTRVRLYIIDIDGEPVDLVEINRAPGEDVGDAILRAHQVEAPTED